MKFLVNIFKGPLNWLGGLLIDKLLNRLIAWIKSAIKDKEEQDKDKKLGEKYDEVVDDDSSSREERKKAADDFLNRRD